MPQTVDQVSLEAETTRIYQRVSQVTLVVRTNIDYEQPAGGGVPQVQVHHWYDFDEA